MNTAKFLQLFVWVSLFYLVGLLFLPEPLLFIGKTVLMPILLMAVGQAAVRFDVKSWLLAALFFSWVGDVALLFAPQGAGFFITGLAAFLVAHFCYIALFLKAAAERKRSQKPITWAFPLILIYVAGLLALLFPHLGDLKIPVVLYALTIGTMLGTALRGWAFWRPNAGGWIVVGAVSFVLSDSILAINKFYSPLPFAGVWIMSTYLFAQFSLVKGLLALADVRRSG